MRICLISSYPPKQCGIGKFAFHLREGLQATKNVDVKVMAINGDHNKYVYGCEVIGEIRADVTSLIEAAHEINQNNFNAVILQHEFSFFSGEYGSDIIRFLEELDCEVVITVIHSPLEHPPDSIKNIVSEIEKRSTYLISLSEKSKNNLVTTYDVFENKIKVIPNGIPEYFVDNKNSIREKYNFSSDRVIAISFGYLSYHKGYDLVLEVLPDIVKTNPEFIYLIIGATHPMFPEGEQYLNHLYNMVNSLAISNNVHFIPRYVTDEELIEYIVAADIFISPYRSDQKSSYTLSHAAFYGKACISTPFFGGAEMLGDGTGLIFPFEDKAALYSGIKLLIDDPEIRKQLGNSIKEKTKNYGWSRIAEDYLQLIP